MVGFLLVACRASCHSCASGPRGRPRALSGHCLHACVRGCGEPGGAARTLRSGRAVWRFPSRSVRLFRAGLGLGLVIPPGQVSPPAQGSCWPPPLLPQCLVPSVVRAIAPHVGDVVCSHGPVRWVGRRSAVPVAPSTLEAEVPLFLQVGGLACRNEDKAVGLGVWAVSELASGLKIAFPVEKPPGELHWVQGACSSHGEGGSRRQRPGHRASAAFQRTPG